LCLVLYKFKSFIIAFFLLEITDNASRTKQNKNAKKKKNDNEKKKITSKKVTNKKQDILHQKTSPPNKKSKHINNSPTTNILNQMIPDQNKKSIRKPKKQPSHGVASYLTDLIQNVIKSEIINHMKQ